GQFKEAEAAYREAELRFGAELKRLVAEKDEPFQRQTQEVVDFVVLFQSRVKARQGRLAEAEVDARRALLSHLREQGKYNFLTPRFVMGLADVLVEQGRYEEAEKLARAALDINREIGVPSDSQLAVELLAFLGRLLNLQGKAREADNVYADLDKAIAQWDPQRREVFELNDSRIYSLYVSGQIERGLKAAQALLRREISQVGETHFRTAVARGTVAIGYMRAGQESDAVREFKAAIPTLITATREIADTDDTTLVAARTNRLQDIAETYIGLLAKSQARSGNAAIETFQLADA